MTAAILRKTFNEVITERYGDGGVTDVSVGDHGGNSGNSGSSVGVNVGVNVGDVPELKLTVLQRIIISIIQSNP